MAVSTKAPPALVNEYQIVHLIYYRSRNQHRISTWWKYFSILHRKLRWVVDNPEDGTTIRYLRKRLLPKCYWEFNLMIALGQFINLGIALVGVVAKVDALLAELEPQAKFPKTTRKHIPTVSRVDTVSGAGSADSTVDMSAIAAITDTFATTKAKSSKKDKKDKKKKKKAKLAIDDIFGS